MSPPGLRDPRRLGVTFVATMALLLALFGGLSWWLLDMDRQLAGQRQLKVNEAAAADAAAGLERRLSEIDRQLGELVASDAAAVATPPVGGALFVRWRDRTLDVWPARGLLYRPAALVPLGQRDDLARAEALSRDALVHRRAGATARALGTYRQLAALGATSVAGMPAALFGQLGALSLYDSQDDEGRARETALDIDRELHAGRWPIAQPTYDFFSGATEDLNPALSRWMPRDDPARAMPRALAAAVHEVWRQQAGTGGRTTDRRVLQTDDGPVLVVWRSGRDGTAVFAAHPTYLAAKWSELSGADVALTGADGRPFLGRAAASGAAIRLPHETKLPWIVRAAGASEDGEAALWTRRVVLVSVLGALLLLILAGGVFIGRAVARDLAVARLQSDFVAAVSHEFRTPLTALCQLTELLVRGRVASNADRQAYYGHLHAESDRLRRLMEGLLNFGRLQAGRMPFQFAFIDTAAFVADSTTAFRKAHPAAHRFEIAAAAVPPVRADAEALRCAFWNLLENAVKYSPDADLVRVAVTSRGRHVDISVSDSGVGIPQDEQHRIFDSFVRGQAARERSIRGTGVGLAMVRQIVRAHGGRVTVDSRPGAGSTFTISLPACAQALTRPEASLASEGRSAVRSAKFEIRS
jgi:signal transduction histidine kinase